MMSNWKKLNKPPVVVALFQLKFNSDDISLADFLKHDSELKRQFPNRKDNIKVGLDLGSTSFPLGVSKISATSDAKIGSYVYFSVNQKVKLEISEGTLTYIDERPYVGWDDFKKQTLATISILSDILNSIEITRTSIRFINRFDFDDFENPQDYFNTQISNSGDKELPFPLRQYGFRLVMDVPESDIYSIANQNVEKITSGSYIYTFDIDVLDKQHLLFDIDTLNHNMDKLRDVKNEIFFNNITEKTENICN